MDNDVSVSSLGRFDIFSAGVVRFLPWGAASVFGDGVKLVGPEDAARRFGPDLDVGVSAGLFFA